MDSPLKETTEMKTSSPTVLATFVKPSGKTFGTRIPRPRPDQDADLAIRRYAAQTFPGWTRVIVPSLRVDTYVH